MPRSRSSQARAAAAIRSAPPAAPAAESLPGWRDRWLWLSVLSVVPLVLHSLGAPLGEPVAEDFDFIRHNVLLAQHSLLDGGGSQAFWRPVPHQLYYWLFGSLTLAHPRWVAAIHVVLLALSAALLYRTLRRWWSGPQAAAAAAFPFLSESIRMVISWPSHGVELCSLLFVGLALHEASRRRMATCLVALALALLSKELTVVAALLIPLLPAVEKAGNGAARRERVRWAIATGALTAVWGLLYLWVRRGAHLELPHHLETDAATLAVPLTARLAWATWNSLRAVMSLPAVSGRWDVAWGLASILTIGAAPILFLRSRGAKSRSAAAMPWVFWGLAWFALSSAALSTIFPYWAPNRALFGSVGLGVALAALLGAAHPLLPWALCALRLFAFAASPGPAKLISVDAADTGAFMDFTQLTRLQRLMMDTRVALQARHATLPHGAVVGQSNMPRVATYAFGGDLAVQCWYRDTTLRWAHVETVMADTLLPVAAIAQFQIHHEPQMAIVEPEALHALLHARSDIANKDWDAALATIDRAEALQRDTAALSFRSDIFTRRSLALYGLERFDEAVAASRRALVLMPENRGARLTLSSILLQHGDYDGSGAQLDTLQFLFPSDSLVARLRHLLDASRRASGR